MRTASIHKFFQTHDEKLSFRKCLIPNEASRDTSMKLDSDWREAEVQIEYGDIQAGIMEEERLAEQLGRDVERGA